MLYDTVNRNGKQLLRFAGYTVGYHCNRSPGDTSTSYGHAIQTTCTYNCVYTYIHIRKQNCPYIQYQSIYGPIYLSRQPSSSTRTHTYIYIYMHVRMFAPICMHMCMYMYMYTLNVYVCVYVYARVCIPIHIIYIYIYTSID